MLFAALKMGSQLPDCGYLALQSNANVRLSVTAGSCSSDAGRQRVRRWASVRPANRTAAADGRAALTQLKDAQGNLQHVEQPRHLQEKLLLHAILALL